MGDHLQHRKIPYNRPDYEAYAQYIEECARKIREAENIEGLSRILEDFFQYRMQVSNEETLAFIRCYQDCTDAFYQEEMQYTQARSAMTDISPVYDALLESSFRKEIDTRFGEQFLLKIEKERSLIKGGLELLGKEQELIARYQNIISSMKFIYEERELSSSELSKYRGSSDPTIRVKARDAFRKGFADRSGELLGILGELVELRGRIARANRYENYLDYANIQKGRYFYGEKELARLCELVRRELVPLKKKLYIRLQSRLGLAAYTANDTGIYFEEGNPEPAGDAVFLTNQAEEMYTRMDRDFAALFGTMKDGEYIDCQESVNKITGMGFCTPIYSEKLSFIFGNCVGRHSDVDILVHEFGHAIQMKMSMDHFSIPEYWDMPNDLAEIPSKAMEQMSYEYASLFFGPSAPQFVETHLITVLEEICSFCMIHEFETWLYSVGAFDSGRAVAEYNRLVGIYDAGVDYSVCKSAMEAGAALVQNKGVYMFPRYLISYALCDISAINIRLICERDKEKGLAAYKKLCGLGGFMEYRDAMKALDLPLPYTEQAVVDTGKYLAEKLGLI